MPHRTGSWVWAGRAAAAAALIGLGVYLWAAGLGQAGRVAAPAGLVIALAALLGPYLLPVYQPPAPPPGPRADPAAPGPGGDVFIAARGSVAARHIGEVTMNPPGPDPGSSRGQAGP